jgi:hypothetical protein
MKLTALLPFKHGFKRDLRNGSQSTFRYSPVRATHCSVVRQRKNRDARAHGSAQTSSPTEAKHSKRGWTDGTQRSKDLSVHRLLSTHQDGKHALTQCEGKKSIAHHSSALGSKPSQLQRDVFTTFTHIENFSKTRFWTMKINHDILFQVSVIHFKTRT